MVEENILIFIWQLICGSISLFLTIIAAKRHQVKKTEITKKLLTAFIIFTLAILSQAAGTYVNYILEINLKSANFGEPNWTYWWFVQLVDQFQFSQILAICGIYYLYLFSTEVFYKEKDLKKNTILGVIVFSAIIFYGMINPLFITTSLGYFDIAYFLFVFGLLLLFPMLRGSLVLIKKLDKSNPGYRNVRYMIMLVLFFLCALVWLGLESLFPGSINIFSYLAWAFIVGSLVTAFLGFFRKL